MFVIETKIQHHMADFSDAEDMQLVQIALKHEEEGTAICWSDVAHRIRRWKANKEKLRLRLKHLKSRYGSKISDFPRRYFARITTAKKNQVKNQVVLKAPSASESTRDTDASADRCIDQLNQFFVDLFDNEQPRIDFDTLSTFRRSNLDVESKSSALDCALNIANPLIQFNTLFNDNVHSLRNTDEMCYGFVQSMFADVSRKDIHQKTGQRDLNMGEISMVGLTKLVASLCIRDDDVFLDVGAGVGNVVSQLALQSPAKKVIGIEIRRAIVMRSKLILSASVQRHPELAKVTMIHGDIRAGDTIARDDVQSSTILYSFNQVFDHISNVKLEYVSCCLRALRIVVISEKFCHRHKVRQMCTNEFCTLWKLQEEVDVGVTFKATTVKFRIYVRR